MPRLAFHAPMKPPDHPVPSGDRRIAQLLVAALERAGWEVVIASRLRTRDGAGDSAEQARIGRAAEAEIARLRAALAPAPPALWFTYHCYWKAPDLIGSALARAFAIPYVVVEGIRAPARLHGPWAGFAEAAEAALDAAAAIFWFTARDRPALEAAQPLGQRLVHLAPFIDLAPFAGARREAPGSGPLRLLAAGMMRAPDKTASYRALAAGLAAAGDLDWRLAVAGDGPAEAEVRAALGPLGPRAAFLGRLDAPALAAAFADADLFVWPGVNEGFGLAYLEAQAAGLPVLAENRPGVREVVAPSGALTPPGERAAFAAALRAFARDRARLEAAGRAARAHVEARHGLDAAARTLGETLAALA